MGEVREEDWGEASGVLCSFAVDSRKTNEWAAYRYQQLRFRRWRHLVTRWRPSLPRPTVGSVRGEPEARVRLGLLGPVELVVGDEAQRIGGARQRALLAYLALNSRVTVPALALLDAVWGDAAPPSVGKSLTTLLARLRKPLERCGGTITHTGAGYLFTVPEDAIDVHRFEQFLAGAKADAATGRYDLAASRLRSALGLWRGAPLADVADAPFAGASAAQLNHRRIEAEDDFVDALIRTGELAEAVAISRQLVEMTPFHEGRWAVLVRTLARSGHQAAALDEYQRARSLLLDELGIEPSARLREAELEVLDQRVDSVRAAAGRPFLAHFIGRSGELEALTEMLGDPPRAAVITGETGIGKTALATEFARRAAREGVLVAHCACVRDDPIALGPLASALEALRGERFGHDAGGSDRRPEPGERHDAGDARPEIEVVIHQRQRSVVEACQWITRSAPLLVVLDDAQWADPVTLSMLRQLMAAVPRLLLVATVRSEDVHASRCRQVFEELARAVRVDTITLTPFSADEVGALVHSQAHFPGISSAIGSIERASGGNPLYASQLAQLLQSTGGVLPDLLPGGIRELMRARLRDLSDECRRILDAASVWRGNFSIETLAAATGREPLAVATLLTEARRSGIVRPTESFDEYEFVHGLVEQVVRDDLEPSYRVRLHAVIASSLVGSDPEAAINRALHLRAAAPVSDPGELVRASMNAGAMATRLASFELAARLYRTAIEFAHPASSEACDAHIRLGEILFAQGSREDGEFHLAVGIEAAERASRWDLVADAVLVRRRLGYLPTTNEACAEAKRIEDIAKHIAPRDVERRVALLSWLANVLVNVDAERAAHALNEAEMLSCSLPESAARFDVRLGRLRQAEALADDPRRCVRDAFDLYRDARAEGASRVAMHAAVLLEAARLRAGELDWDPEHEEFVEHARTAGYVEAGVLLDVCIAARGFAAQPLAAAEALMDHALERGRSHGHVMSFGVWGMQAFGIRREQCHLHELEALLGAVAGTGRGGLQGLQAACRLEAGDRAGAQALVDAFVADALPTLARDWVHDTALALVADAAFELGVDPGPRLYEKLEVSAGHVIVMCSAALVVGRADRFLGQLAALSGDHDRAIEHLTRARELDTASGCRLGAGWAAHDEAVVRTARCGPGDGRRADELRQHARDVARWAGSLRLARAVAV